MTKDIYVTPGLVILMSSLLPGHLFNWGVEWSFVLILSAVGACCYYFDDQSDNRRSAFTACLIFGLMLMCWALIALFWSSLTGTYESGPRDLFDAMRPVVYLYCIYPLWRSNEMTIRHLSNIYKIVYLYSLFWFLVLYLDIPLLSGVYELLYGDTKTRVEEFIVRLSVPFENPNFLGFISTLSLTIAFAGRKPDWTLIGLSVACAALSGSRTAWVVSSLIIFGAASVGICFAEDSFVRLKRLSVFLSVVTVIFAIVSWVGDSYQRLSDLVSLLLSFDLSSDFSYGERIALRADAWQAINNRLFFGWGAAKYAPFSVLDNQYYGVVLRYGVCGSFIIALAILYVLIPIFAKPSCGVYKSLLCGLILVLAIWAWNANVLENARLFILIFATFACVGLSRSKNAEG